MVSDENAQVVWQDRYEPFGGDEELSGTIENTYKFTGKGYDPDADLYYFNARWYDKDVGRFISEDPLWGNIWDPQSLNRFAYGRNNPYRYTDPSGNITESVSFDDNYGDVTDDSWRNSPNEGDQGGGNDMTTPTEQPESYEDAIRKKIRDDRAASEAMKELRDFLDNFQTPKERMLRRAIELKKAIQDAAIQAEKYKAALALIAAGEGYIALGWGVVKVAENPQMKAVGTISMVVGAAKVVAACAYIHKVSTDPDW